MKEIRSDRIGSNLIVLLIVLNSISFFYNQLFRIYTSLSLYGNFIVLIMIFLLRGVIHPIEMKNYSLLWFFSIFGFTTVLITKGGIGSVITPVFGFFLLFILYNTKFNRYHLKILLITFITLNIYWVINSKGYYLKALFNKKDFINSNTIGMVLMYSSIYIKILAYKLKIKYRSIVVLIVYSLSIFAILNVESRTSLITLIIFILLDSFPLRNFIKNKKTGLLIFVLTIVAGTMLPFVYTYLYNGGFSFTIPFTSKPLYTGREIIWNNFFREINSNSLNWITGLGSKAELWIGNDLNMHNNYLAVITNFGAVGFLIYYGIILYQINIVYKIGKLDNCNTSLLIGFLVVLINGYLEVSTLWDVMFFFNFMFIGFAFNFTETHRA